MYKKSLIVDISSVVSDYRNAPCILRRILSLKPSRKVDAPLILAKNHLIDIHLLAKKQGSQSYFLRSKLSCPKKDGGYCGFPQLGLIKRKPSHLNGV
jgi:hypothetical protein